ncbi:MAG: hypothetical protein U9R75_09990 [Candidatus Thermoplasmatota archaeon]|nr:hypothetical protein [Candidatus Thermoplasmatota archaeon]
MPKISGSSWRRRRRGHPKKRSRLVLMLRSILSGLVMTTAVFLILWALGELFVRLLNGKSAGGAYTDWGMVPLVFVLASIPFFILYIIVNYDRIGVIQRVIERLHKEKAPKEIEIVELD